MSFENRACANVMISILAVSANSIMHFIIEKAESESIRSIASEATRLGADTTGNAAPTGPLKPDAGVDIGGAYLDLSRHTGIVPCCSVARVVGLRVA